MHLFRPVIIAAMVAFATMASARSNEQPVTVFAAASLQDVLTAVASQFTAETNRPVRFSFAASSAVVRQIEQGAPADILAAADADWADYAQQKNLIRPQSRIDLLGNRLVLIAPKDAPVARVALTADAIQRALGDSRLATGEVTSVPIGRYAKEALQKLALWDTVAPRLAQTENVRAALRLVAHGEAALGIVYATDVRVEPQVKVVAEFPQDAHAPIVYPFAVTATAHGDGPDKLMAFIRGPQARRIFATFGFIVLAPHSQ